MTKETMALQDECGEVGCTALPVFFVVRRDLITGNLVNVAEACLEHVQEDLSPALLTNPDLQEELSAELAELQTRIRQVRELVKQGAPVSG